MGLGGFFWGDGQLLGLWGGGRFVGERWSRVEGLGFVGWCGDWFGDSGPGSEGQCRLRPGCV